MTLASPISRTVPDPAPFTGGVPAPTRASTPPAAGTTTADGNEGRHPAPCGPLLDRVFPPHLCDFEHADSLLEPALRRLREHAA